jgi:hypothetical protein
VKIPIIQGVIERRLLINYRITLDVARKVVPQPFRPKCINGFTVAGICLIRLSKIRPLHVPAMFGITSENAAHRFAVEWDENGEIREGVYITRRDTNSRLNAITGGRLFPGFHHYSKFSVAEIDDKIVLDVHSSDGLKINVIGKLSSSLPDSSVFKDLGQASEFFRGGSTGYSISKVPGMLDGLKLDTKVWEISPFSASQVQSSFYDDRSIFPADSIRFDSVLLMRNIPHTWSSEKPFTCACDSLP